MPPPQLDANGQPINPPPQNAPLDNTAPPVTSTEAPAPTPTPQVMDVPQNYPMGIVIPGKPGFVKSPYAEFAGEVDVRSFSPGQAVRCPFTKKIFIVPPQN